MNNYLGISIVTFAIFVSINTAQAKDFGKKGHSYKISEQGFLVMIEERLSKVDPEEIREHMQKVASDRVKNPEAVGGIEKTEKTRVFYFDPGYVVDEDIMLPCGQLLHAKGTRVNPLDHMEFDRELYFIDARDRDQVKWIKSKLGISSKQEKDSEELSERLEKIILTGGSPQVLQEELGRDVYFDQKGELSSRFGIKHVPALVIGEGKFLKIIEEKLSK